MQSDPIGLEGEINTYTYIEENPLIRIDQKGQHGYVVTAAWWWVCSYYSFQAASAALPLMKNLGSLW